MVKSFGDSVGSPPSRTGPRRRSSFASAIATGSRRALLGRRW
jgi:hypothetical protein